VEDSAKSVELDKLAALRDGGVLTRDVVEAQRRPRGDDPPDPDLAEPEFSSEVAPRCGRPRMAESGGRAKAAIVGGAISVAALVLQVAA
jgi:hypothetical protein